MPDIFDEVTEDLKKENLAALVKKYGKSVGLGCFFILLAVSVYVGWQGWRQSAEGKAVTAYMNATNLLAGGAANRGITSLSDLVENAPHPVKEMAGLRAGAYLLQQSKKAEAFGLYQKIADSSNDEPFRSLAIVILAKNTIGNKDEENKYDVKNRLQLVAAGSLFAASAEEMLALMAIENGDAGTAKKNLLLISNNSTAPPGIKKRAEDLLVAYEK